VVTGEDMAAVVMDQDLDSGTNPPAYEDLRIAKMLKQDTKKTEINRSFQTVDENVKKEHLPREADAFSTKKGNTL
jgi:hypothetical protein